MIFTVDNVISKGYFEHFKPFMVSAVVVSANGFELGFTEAFDALIDTGAKHTSIARTKMAEILQKIKDGQGNSLQVIGHVNTQGVYGGAQVTPLYLLPHLYLNKIHLTDVVVAATDSDNYSCLIGRSILHQCVATYNPEEDTMTFDFKESLKQTKQRLQGYETFGDVQLYAEFGDNSTQDSDGILTQSKSKLTRMSDPQIDWNIEQEIKKNLTNDEIKMKFAVTNSMIDKVRTNLRHT